MYTIAAGDFNGDGIADVVSGYERLTLHPGNGTGGFNAPVDLTAGARLFHDLALVDIENDGDLDVVAVAKERSPPEPTIEASRPPRVS